MTSITQVLAANRAFYDAHEARELSAMSVVWEHADRVVCIHPGWPILRGWHAVEQSWRLIFEGPGRNQFIITNELAEVIGDAAWVNLEENLVDRGDTHTIAATNVFALIDGEWKMTAHHGSPVLRQS